MTRVPFTIKILVITNLHSIIRASHNSLTVVSSVEVHILVLIVKQQQFDCCEVCEGLHYNFDCQTRNQLVYVPNPGEPEGSDDYTEVTLDEEQCLFDHYSAPVTPSPLAYTPSIPFLATMEPLDTFLMGDEVISTIPASPDLGCNMPIDSPCTDVFGDALVNIDLPLGEPLDTLSTEDREIKFNPSRDIEELEHLLANDPVLVPRVFDDPLGNSDSISRSFEISDLFEELIAEIGLDDSILIRTDDRYYDSEDDILFFEPLLNEDTSSDVSPALLPTKSSSLVLPFPILGRFA
ncbi:hypothetical protein Tco_1426962 [Tanacetum coccineum]